MSLVEQALTKMRHETAKTSAPSAAPSSATDPVAAPRGGAAEFARSTRVVPSLPARPMLLVDKAALRREGLMPPESFERQIGQQYRRIKRPLVEHAFSSPQPFPHARTLAIASASPGEGKTFTSINLAMSIAREKDIEVLLVDADIPKPHITKLLGVSDVPGLTDALRDSEVDVESLIHATDIPNLLFCPAGSPAGDNGTELLSSDRMGEIVAQLENANRRRIVLIDTPPLLDTTESQAIAHRAGQVVVVVRSGVTGQDTVLDALSYLGERPGVFLVLNQSDEEAPSGYYYPGYGDQFRGSENA